MGPVLGRDPLIPPKRLLRYGRDEFALEGDALLDRLLDLTPIAPGSRVLDVDCGVGQVARPLARYLRTRQGGVYEGFDSDRDAIGWCRRAYRRHRHVRFLVADVFHPRERPGGAHRREEYRFPYEGASFDLVIAAGVLAHLLEGEAAHYLEEIDRVLAPGGTLFATCFVLDEDSRGAIARGDAALSFLDADGHVAMVSEDLPDEAVAYDRDWLAARMPAAPEVHPGAWRGAEEAESLLDIVVASRA